jgi:hypothetical protein
MKTHRNDKLKLIGTIIIIVAIVFLMRYLMQHTNSISAFH